MKQSNSNQQLQAIVVGCLTDSFIRYAIDLLGEYQIDAVHCEDVYSAASRLARRESEKVLVIGRLEQLDRERGQFFRKISGNGVFCCCLCENSSAQRQKQISSATELGILVISQPAEIESAVAKLLTEDPALPVNEQGCSSSSGFFKDDFRITDAERNALLEPLPNENI